MHDALSNSGWSAMELKMETLHQNGTLVPLLPRKQTIGCKWVYTLEFNPDGYTQTYSIDYDETFSPIAKISSILVFISLAADLNWTFFQLDVKKCLFIYLFFTWDLQEEFYMEEPPRFVVVSSNH